MEEDVAASGTGFFAALSTLADGVVWFVQNILMAFYNFFYALTHPQSWLFWGDGAALARFIYYGGSVEFFFVVFTLFLVITALGMAWKRQILWGGVIGLEFMANWVGRFFAWAGLIMVIQQVIIVFSQRIFAQASLTFGFGTPVQHDISWWSEELKLYNAMIVCLCVTYTFVQGGHVRVDLVYAAVSHRSKRVIDMLGSLFFMMPAIVLTWLFAWYFMWRHLVNPPPSASTPLDRLLTQGDRGVLRWSVETTGFSPNGFSAYFLFKVLLVLFCAMVFLQAVAFFWRSYLEWLEGEESVGKYIDKDKLGDTEAELAAEIH
ncbi:C4-dicarboxylate ABC transporter permease [Rhodophyticola sp. CCM32]|uniref:TRAP transporter small permease subunit n=1 Tax=Rhodophyticola sp. CCM32 TaxID=2916397 RepID=UPI00107F698F|nr:TRAP transporter small permease subunit [Rhodophyticola sp. CCM32]QBY00713.1 C4-dicarboxylate ABC transporter permease [Rhodophyticola sp. CCM32]